MRLMIVDDEEAARYGMRRALTTFGYNISEAGSAEAARALLKQHEPDLLLLDVNLPGMSGLDFLRELKTANGNAPLVIIITAHGSERMADRKSTRLNSSHLVISYAVFCLKKKKKRTTQNNVETTDISSQAAQ